MGFHLWGRTESDTTEALAAAAAAAVQTGKKEMDSRWILKEAGERLSLNYPALGLCETGTLH